MSPNRDRGQRAVVRPVADRSPARAGGDEMPLCRPETKLVVQYFDRLKEEVWTLRQRREFDARCFYRDDDQGLIEFWQGMWFEHAPEVARHGRYVRWAYHRQQWEPYRVDGVHLEGGELKAVVLKDRRGRRWSALPQDLESAGAPRLPVASVTLTTHFRGPQTHRLSVDEAVDLFQMMARHIEDPLWNASQTSYRRHVKLTAKSTLSAFSRTLRVSHGVALLATDQRYQITQSGADFPQPHYHARFNGVLLGTYATDLEAAQQLFDWNVERTS